MRVEIPNRLYLSKQKYLFVYPNHRILTKLAGNEVLIIYRCCFLFTDVTTLVNDGCLSHEPCPDRDSNPRPTGPEVTAKPLSYWAPNGIYVTYTLQKKVTHNILVNRQVQIIVAVTCGLCISYVIEYKE